MALPPLHYLLPLFPGFQLLDLAGPLDILNLLSLRVDRDKTPLTFTFIAETLDPVPVKPIPPKSANWSFDLKTGFPSANGRVNTTFNQYLLPDTTFSEYLKALESGKPERPVDVLLIPGGWGTRIQRVHPDGSRTLNIQSVLDFVPKVAPYISTAIITVCTGSDALAQTGLLNGRRATTNISLFEQVAKRSPQVNWQSFARWVRSLASEASSDKDAAPIDIWTSAGISAGMDVTLAFIAHFYGGIEVSRGLAKSLEYDWREIDEAAKDPLYEKHYAV